jgi:single-strand DNA-binding protein
VVLQNFNGTLVMLDGRGGEGGASFGGGGGRERVGAGEAPASFQRDEMDDEIPF